MQLSEICIKRPVFTIVLSLILVTIGIIFFNRLEIRDIPNITYPIVSVNAYYAGADAVYMEQQITTRLESVLKTLKNLDSISSTSSAGNSTITLAFKLDTDIENAVNDARSKIADISRSFPTDMDMPTVNKMDSDNFPALWLSVSSDRHTNLELTAIINDHIKEVLEKLPAVGNAYIYGASYYTMVIEPVTAKLMQHKISPMEIEQAIIAQNKDYPAGSLKTETREFTLQLHAALSEPEEFAEVIVKKYDDGTLIKLREVANVSLKSQENNVILRYNGKRSIAVGIVKQSTANIIELSNSINLELVKIQADLPQGIRVEVAYDEALAVKESIKAVFKTMLEALILVVGVIYLFLGSLRITLIPIVTIPISLISTFTVMYLFGFSVNTFTLLAMILAIGLVVDDAIVMLENIFRHNHELGKPVMHAAYAASKEIGFAIIAMTITLAAVFLPIGFIEGFLGKLFIEFAWTLAFCVLFSGFIALTLTPMMAAGMIRPENHKPNIILQKFNYFIHKTQAAYSTYLELVLNNKKIFFSICVGSIIILGIGFIYVNKIFVPVEDQGFLRVIFTGPEGSNVIESEKTVHKAEEILAGFEEIKGYFAIVGSGGGDSAFAFVPLKDWHDRNKSQEQIKNELNQKFAAIPEMSIFAVNPQSLGSGGGSGKMLEFNIQSSLAYSEIDKLSKLFIARMNAMNLFQNVERDYKSSTPAIDIIINREKAYYFNTSLDTIGKTIQYLIAGRKIGDFRKGNDIYDIVLQYGQEDRKQLSDLKTILIKTGNNDLLPMEVLADIKQRITVKSYDHYNTAKTIGISADLAIGKNITEAISAVDEIAANILDKNNTKIEYTGEVKQLNDSNSGILVTFLLALIFIYLVLSAQFESFTDALLILIAVPFSMTGGILALLIAGNSLNIYSEIGLITLIGLITKNSILIVEFANQLKQGGLSVRDAVVKSAHLRLRPILMTSIATIIGAIPLLAAHGAGAAARNSIGLVIVGGMTLGTVFTIFVIPAIYDSFKRDREDFI